MPTEPIKDSIGRDRVLEMVKPFTQTASPLLKEVVDYAADALDHCQSSKKADREEAYPLLNLYSHTIQMADSIEVLVSSGCGLPATLLVRSSFEARLSIKYILEENTDKRSIAWLIKHYDDEISFLEIMDKENPKGKEYRETLKDDIIYKLVGPPPSLPGISEQITKLKAKLDQPSFAEVYTEYKHNKTKSRPYPEWYSLFGGPRNIKALARHFHEGSLYESLYRTWSKTSHAHEATELFPIRNPIPIAEVASNTVSRLLEIISLMLNHFQSNRVNHFEKWMQRDVMPKLIILQEFTRGHLAFLDREMKKGTHESN